MKYSKIEEAIYVISNHVVENVTLYCIANEVGKKHEKGKGLWSHFYLILKRLSHNEHIKTIENIDFKEKIQNRKLELKDSVAIIKSSNLNDNYVKEELKELLKSTDVEYNVDLFIEELRDFEVEFSNMLKEEKITIKSEKELIMEDVLFETILSTKIIKNLYKNDYLHLEKYLRCYWLTYFIPGEREYEEHLLKKDTELIFIRNLELIVNISKEILQKLNSKLIDYKVLEEIENEKVSQIYLYASKIITKNFQSDEKDNFHFIKTVNEIIESELNEVLKKSEIIKHSSYWATYQSLILMIKFEEKTCKHKNIDLFNTLSSNMKIIINYFKENLELKENLNGLLDDTMFYTYHNNQAERLLNDYFDFLLNKVDFLEKKKNLKQVVEPEPITTEKVREAIKFVVNNYMASEDFYNCLLDLREKYSFYGLNITRFRLALIQISNLLELKNSKEEISKKTLRL